MPNWCSNSVSFVSEDKKQIEKVVKRIREVMRKPVVKYTSWEDYIVTCNNKKEYYYYDKLLSLDNKKINIVGLNLIKTVNEKDHSKFLFNVTIQNWDEKKKELIEQDVEMWSREFPLNSKFIKQDYSLYNIVLGLAGLKEPDDAKIEGNARGSLTDYSQICINQKDNFYYCEIFCDSAWDSPSALEWAIKYNNEFENVKVLMMCDEPGCDYHYNSDEEGIIYPWRCGFDSDIDETYGIENCFTSEEEMIDTLKMALKDVYPEVATFTAREEFDKYFDENFDDVFFTTFTY